MVGVILPPSPGNTDDDPIIEVHSFYEMLTSIWISPNFYICVHSITVKFDFTGYFLLQFLPKIIIFETCSKPEGFVLILKILPLWLFRQSKQKTVKLLRFTSVKN